MGDEYNECNKSMLQAQPVTASSNRVIRMLLIIIPNHVIELARHVYLMHDWNALLEAAYLMTKQKIVAFFWVPISLKTLKENAVFLLVI